MRDWKRHKENIYDNIVKQLNVIGQVSQQAPGQAFCLSVQSCQEEGIGQENYGSGMDCHRLISFQPG
jgi:hypothetical protein